VAEVTGSEASTSQSRREESKATFFKTFSFILDAKKIDLQGSTAIEVPNAICLKAQPCTAVIQPGYGRIFDRKDDDLQVLGEGQLS